MVAAAEPHLAPDLDTSRTEVVGMTVLVGHDERGPVVEVSLDGVGGRWFVISVLTCQPRRDALTQTDR